MGRNQCQGAFIPASREGGERAKWTLPNDRAKNEAFQGRKQQVEPTHQGEFFISWKKFRRKEQAFMVSEERAQSAAPQTTEKMGSWGGKNLWRVENVVSIPVEY